MSHVVKGPINEIWKTASRVMLTTPPHGGPGSVRIDWAMVDEIIANGQSMGMVQNYHIAVALAAVRDGTWEPIG